MNVLGAISPRMSVFCGIHEPLEIYLDGVMVGETGIEPVTPDLEGPCSIRLSYSPVRVPEVIVAGRLGECQFFAAKEGDDAIERG
jgi:hypothetical protein